MPGSQKLLLEFDGKPMVRHAMESASEGGCTRSSSSMQQMTCVTLWMGGRSSSTIQRPAPELPLLCRSAWARCAMRSRRPVVLLGDQPWLALAPSLRSCAPGGARVHGPRLRVTATCEWAPPVVLARELWTELFALKGDAGARQILQGHLRCSTWSRAGSPRHIDTPEDYAKIVRLFPRKKPRQRA